MQTKLTLRLDDKLIKRAKAYARRTGKSLSRIVAHYFSLLSGGPEEPSRQALTPTVAKLKGALRGTRLAREDYRRYLEEKFR